MAAEGKKQSVDDLMKIFSNPEELKKHVYTGTWVKQHKASDIFHMDVPYDEIKEIVLRHRDVIFQNLDPDAKKPVFEHVGSTSIKGMPGSLSPDILVVEETLPPSRSTVAAILAAGFEFQSVAPHDPEDLWFWKFLQESPCEGQVFTLHLVSESNKLGKLLVLARDTCNSDRDSFEEYKRDKLAAKAGEGTTMLDYKLKKRAGTFIPRMREKVGLPPAGIDIKGGNRTNGK